MPVVDDEDVENLLLHGVHHGIMGREQSVPQNGRGAHLQSIMHYVPKSYFYFALCN